MNIMRFVVPKSLVEFVTLDSTVRQALEKMRYHRYAAIPVIDARGNTLALFVTTICLAIFSRTAASIPEYSRE